MNDDIIKTTFVFGYALGLNIGNFQKSFKKMLKKYLQINARLKNIIDLELFIWLWVLTEYYGSLILINERMDEEEYLFRKIHKLFFDEVIEGREDEHVVYEFYGNYISQTLNTRREDYEGQDYDQRVKEKLIGIFSLKIFKYINPEIMEMNIDDLNKKFGNHIVAIQRELDIYCSHAMDLIIHYFKEAEESGIREVFGKIRNTKLVKKIMKNLD